MTNQEALAANLERFIHRARNLSDEDRLRLADARAALDETFHVGAWRAANEIAVQHGRGCHEAWVRIGPAFIPDRLEDLVRQGRAADASEVARWQEVARLARLAMDDAILVLVTADLIRPPDLRELYGPWKAMLEAHKTGAPHKSA